MNTCRISPALLVAVILAAAGSASAESSVTGALSLSSDRVERGLSQSSGQASAAADLEWSHGVGAFVGLGAATVDPDQYGGASLKWSPRAGLRLAFGDSPTPLRASAGLSAQLFPGASGSSGVTLPPRLAERTGTQAQQTDFATAELNLGLAWRAVSLSFDRALTDYHGIGADSTQTGPLGQRITQTVADSAGSWHIGLQLRHDFGEHLAAWAGAGRQVVKNFDELNYNDWWLGASWRERSFVFTLQGSGTSASADAWRVRRSDGSTRELSGQRVTVSLAWAFGG